MAHARSGAEEVPEFVVTAAKPSRGWDALEATHRSTSALDTTMILLEAIVEIAVCSMPYAAAELRPDRPGVGVMAVRRDPVGNCVVTAFADRKKRLAAARLRCSLSITSTRAPSRSIARYRYFQRPCTRIYGQLWATAKSPGPMAHRASTTCCAANLSSVLGSPPSQG